MHRLLLKLALAAMLAGCGLKGDLYLPESKPAQKPPAKRQPAPKPQAPAPEAPASKPADDKEATP